MPKKHKVFDNIKVDRKDRDRLKSAPQGHYVARITRNTMQEVTLPMRGKNPQEVQKMAESMLSSDPGKIREMLDMDLQPTQDISVEVYSA